MGKDQSRGKKPKTSNGSTRDRSTLNDDNPLPAAVSLSTFALEKFSRFIFPANTGNEISARDRDSNLENIATAAQKCLKVFLPVLKSLSLLQRRDVRRLQENVLRLFAAAAETRKVVLLERQSLPTQ